jgi:hypothetical protein
MELAFLPWVERMLATGQRLGAVRTDLPSGLLLAVATGMGRAMDTGLVTQPPEEESLPEFVGIFTTRLRGALQP